MKTHTGNFVPGQQGVFTITITNNGTEAAPGPILVTDPMPVGLTLVSANGVGWNCGASKAALLSCVHGGPLPGLATLPSITLTVRIAANAPAALTNVATLVVDGDVNRDNNTDSDTIRIVPPAQAPLASPAGLLALIGVLLAIATRSLRSIKRRS